MRQGKADHMVGFFLCPEKGRQNSRPQKLFPVRLFFSACCAKYVYLLSLSISSYLTTTYGHRAKSKRPDAFLYFWCQLKEVKLAMRSQKILGWVGLLIIFVSLYGALHLTVAYFLPPVTKPTPSRDESMVWVVFMLYWGLYAPLFFYVSWTIIRRTGMFR